MHLGDARLLRNKRRDDWLLKGAGGDDDIVGLDAALRGGDGETGASGIAAQLGHLGAAADGGGDLFGIGGEVIGDLFLGHESVGGGVELHAGKAVMPGGAVGDQRIPPLGAPAFGDAAALKHQMRDTGPAQMLAHGDACLAGADDKRVDLVN